MPLENSPGSITSRLKAKVAYVLEKLYISSRVKEVQAKTNEIVTEAEISAQSEMIKRTLAEREKQIAKDLEAGKNIRQAKDATRQSTYATLTKEEKTKQAKKAESSFTK